MTIDKIIVKFYDELRTFYFISNDQAASWLESGLNLCSTMIFLHSVFVVYLCHSVIYKRRTKKWFRVRS